MFSIRLKTNSVCLPIQILLPGVEIVHVMSLEANTAGENERFRLVFLSSMMSK